MLSYQIITQLKEDQVSLDRSPEFCFKRLIYRYLLKTGHALGLELAIDPPPPPGGILYTMIFWNYII